MFCVVDHFLAVIFQIFHGLRDQLEVFFFRDAERTMHVQIPALAEDGDGWGFGF